MLVTAKLQKFRRRTDKFATNSGHIRQSKSLSAAIGRHKGDPMKRKHLALAVAAALALSLSACGKDADDTTSSSYKSDPTLTAKGPETMSKALGERPGSPANPSGLSDTSPSIPGNENRPEKKEQPFGQGSPQTSMKGVDIPVAGTSNENRAEGRSYERGG
jgi:hypothetical protein